MTLHRHLTNTPYLLVALFIIGSFFALVRFTDEVANTVINGIVHARSGGAYTVTIEGTSFPDPDTVTVPTVTIVANNPSLRVSAVELADLAITYDLTAPFRGELREALRDLSVEETAVYLRIGTDVAPPGSESSDEERSRNGADSHSEIPDDIAASPTRSGFAAFIEGTARWEETVFRSIEEFFLPRPIATSLEIYTEGYADDTGSPEEPVGTGTVEVGIRSLVADLAIGRYQAIAMVVTDDTEHTTSRGNRQEPPRTETGTADPTIDNLRRGTLSIDGPGVALSATVDAEELAVDGRIRSAAFAHPASGTATADASFLRALDAFEHVSLEARVGITEPTRESSEKDPEAVYLRSGSSLPVTEGLRYLYDTVQQIAPGRGGDGAHGGGGGRRGDDTRGGDGGALSFGEREDLAEIAALLPEFRFAIDADGITPAALGLPVPPDWYVPRTTITAVIVEDRIGVSGSVDGGSLGNLSLQEVVIPRDTPEEFTVSGIQLSIPQGVVFPSRLVPSPLLRILQIDRDAPSEDETVSLPELALNGAMGTAGTIRIDGTIDDRSRYRIVFGATVDTVNRMISDAVATVRARNEGVDGDVTLSFSAPWDAVARVGFGTIPDEMSGEIDGEVRLTDTDPRYVEILGTFSDGALRIDEGSGRFGGFYFSTGGSAGRRRVATITGNGEAFRLDDLALSVAAVGTDETRGIGVDLIESEDVPHPIVREPSILTLEGDAYRDGIVAEISLARFDLAELVRSTQTGLESSEGAESSETAESPEAADSSETTESPEAADLPEGVEPAEGVEPPERVQPVPYQAPVLSGTIDTTIEVDTRPDRPRFSIDLSGDEIDLFGQRGSVAFRILQDGDSVLIPSGDVRFDPLVTASVAGRLPVAIARDRVELLNLVESTLEVDIRSPQFSRFFPRDEDEQRPDGSLSASITLAERTGDLSGTVRFRGRPGMDAATRGGEGFGFDELTGRVRITEEDNDRLVGEFSLTADDREVLTLSADATVPGLSRASPKAELEEITWRLTGRSDLPLEYIAPFVPGVVALTGTIDGSISGSGSLASPRIGGEVALRDGDIRLSGSLPPISAINGVLRFDDRRYHSEEIRGEVGLAPFSVRLEGDLPTPDDPGGYTIRLNGTNLLVSSSPSLRVRADVDAALRRNGDAGNRLDGTVTIRDAIYSQQIPLVDFDAIPQLDPEVLQLFSVPGRFGENTRLDVEIIADETIQVENNLYDGAFSADLSLEGTLGIPRPSGRVFTDSGTLRLPLTSISLRQGVLRFPVDRPFSPELQARGTTQLRDYRLTITVQGSLPEVEVDVTTVPALPQSEALVLLMTGFTPEEMRRSGNRTALALGSRLGTQVVQSLLGSSGEAGSELADRVNIILGEGVSEGGAETIEIEFRLTDEDSWFLVFRRDRFERYNMDLAWRFWLD